MAKAPVRPVANRASAGRRGGGRSGAGTAASASPLINPTNRIILTLAMLALVPFALPTLLLLFVGMLPTLAAAFAERGTARQAWVSVGGLNFAGLSYWLLNLWFAHHTLTYAIAQLRAVTPLLVAYAASALGWALYLAMPPLVNAVTTVTLQRRVVTLAAQQRKLVEQWGDGVINRDSSSKSNGSSSSSAQARGRA